MTGADEVKFPHYYSEAYVQGVLDKAAESTDENTARLVDLVRRYKPNPRPGDIDWDGYVRVWDEFKDSDIERRSEALWETIEHFGFPCTNNPGVTTDVPEIGDVIAALKAGLEAASRTEEVA